MDLISDVSKTRKSIFGITIWLNITYLLLQQVILVSCEPKEPQVHKVIVTPTTVTIEVGETTQLEARVEDYDGNILSDRTIIWSSTKPSNASVSEKGLVTGLAAEDLITITAKCEGISGSSHLTIKPKHIDYFDINPVIDTIEIGETLQLNATLKDAQGNLLTGRDISWSSNNINIATVSTTGLVTGVSSKGTVVITAICEGLTKTANILVTEAKVASVVVDTKNSTFFEGDQVQLSATILDARGSMLLDRTILWSSSNTDIATVSETGLLSLLKSGGPIIITAICESKLGETEIIINLPERVVYWIEYLPAQISIALERNTSEYESYPSGTYAPMILEKIAILQDPNLASEMIENRYFISFKLASIDGSKIPFTTFFITEEMRSGAELMMNTYNLGFPILETFMKKPLYCDNVDIVYGFTIGDLNRGCFLEIEDKETYEARTVFFYHPYLLPFELICLHELSHCYIGNEAIMSFLCLYLYNVVKTNSSNFQSWIYNYGPYIPFDSSNTHWQALLDIYQLIGVERMSNAYAKLGDLYPPYGVKLSAECKQTFIDEAPSHLKEQVAALTEKIDP